MTALRVGAAVEITYGGMSTGTLALSEVPAKAGQLADKLVSLNAELHHIMEMKGFAAT
jgi:hypothetical protein